MARKRGPKNEIEKHPGLKAEVDRLLSEGWILDDIEAHLKTMKLESTPSRSSIQRYSATAAKLRTDMDQMHTVSSQLVKEFGKADNDVSRFIYQMGQSIAYKLMHKQAGDDDGLDIQDFMRLMKAVKDLSSARNSTLAAEQRIKEQLRAGVVKAIDQAEFDVLNGKITPAEALRIARTDIYGMFE